MGKQTRKTLLQYLQDKGIPLRQAIEMLEQAQKQETAKNEKEYAVIKKYDTR